MPYTELTPIAKICFYIAASLFGLTTIFSCLGMIWVANKIRREMEAAEANESYFSIEAKRRVNGIKQPVH